MAVRAGVRNGRRASAGQDRTARNVVATVVCLTMMWIGVKVRAPYLEADKMVAGNQTVEKKMLQKEIDLQRQEKALRALQTDAGMEQELRKNGYVRKGEVMLVVPERH